MASVEVDAPEVVLALTAGAMGGLKGVAETAGADLGRIRESGADEEPRDVAVVLDAVLAEDSARLRPELAVIRETELAVVVSDTAERGEGSEPVTAEDSSDAGLILSDGLGLREVKGGRTGFAMPALDGPTAAADAALPRGMRSPWPGPDSGEAGDLAGNDTEDERRFEWDRGLRASDGEAGDGTGELNRLADVLSYSDVGLEDVTDVARWRSMVVAIRRRVRADGASSSSLPTMETQYMRHIHALRNQLTCRSNLNQWLNPYPL